MDSHAELEEEIPAKSDMTGFLASHEKYTEFREFINHLLSTFMDDETRNIFMSEEAIQIQSQTIRHSGFPSSEPYPLGVNEKLEAAEGPFAIIKRAFTHSNLSGLNLESLETLGDGVLNAVVTLIIVTNWPNLLLQPSQVANMKKYHTNNINIAKYAQKLGFIRWVVRHPGQGLDDKERADIFESFIGAIVLIGEFYIGSEMGWAYAKLFLMKFFATERWYPESPEFYEVGETLYNDWTTALPPDERPKSKFKERREDDGRWRYTRTISDPEGSKSHPVKKITGVSSITFTSVTRTKKDAKHVVMMKIAEELKLSRNNINIERDNKRATMPEVNSLVNKIVQLGTTMGKQVFVTGTKKAAKRVYVFVKEKVKAKVGGRELYYERFIVSGEGNNEIEALKDAFGKMQRRELYKTVAGVECEIWNPDDDIIAAPEDRSQAPRQEIPARVDVKKEGEKSAKPRYDKPYNPKKSYTPNKKPYKASPSQAPFKPSLSEPSYK